MFGGGRVRDLWPSAIKAFDVDEHTLLVVLTGEEALGERRALIGKRVIGGDDASSPALSPFSTSCLAAYPATMPPPQTIVLYCLHVTEDISALAGRAGSREQIARRDRRFQ